MSQESELTQLRDQAAAAYGQGRPTFVARLKATQWGMSAGEVPFWMDSVDPVESCGWTLDQWSELRLRWHVQRVPALPAA